MSEFGLANPTAGSSMLPVDKPSRHIRIYSGAAGRKSNVQYQIGSTLTDEVCSDLMLIHGSMFDHH